MSEVNNIDTYDGEFYKGKRQGQGKITYKDGSVFVGQWVFDERCGQGTEYVLLFILKIAYGRKEWTIAVKRFCC